MTVTRLAGSSWAYEPNAQCNTGDHHPHRVWCPQYPEWWENAKAECLDGHPAGCTYGGLTPFNGYWLVMEECTLLHGDRCAGCDADSMAGFGDWGPPGTIWGFGTCQRHTDEILAIDPRWLG